MTLTHVCPHCRKENKVNGRFHSRYEIAQIKGEKFEKDCRFCGKKMEVVPNDIVARENRYSGILFIMILVLGLMMGYFIITNYVDRNSEIMIGLLLIIPILVYTTYSRAEMSKIRDFNRIKYD